MLICVWCFAACENQDDDKVESAIVTITVADGASGKTVYMYANAFPTTYADVVFGAKQDANDMQAFATAVTDATGVAIFVIDGSELTNSYKRWFYFSMMKDAEYQYDRGITCLIRCGDKISLQMPN